MKDTRTRYAGVFARHRRDCTTWAVSRCPCKPSYWGKAWDRATGRHVRTARFSTPSAAARAREDLIAALRAGQGPQPRTLRLDDAVDRFLDAARSGRALNKHGRRYRPGALRDLESCLLGHVVPTLGRRRLGDVRRAHVQELIDGVELSGSRVRSIANAIRSLYAWAQQRELVEHDPAARVHLPALDSTPRDRVATPDEMARLLDALSLADALPSAIAAYGGLRLGEILALTVGDVDLDARRIRVRDGKTLAARRVVPVIAPLAAMIRRRLLELGRPDDRALLCPGIKPGGRNSGRLSPVALQRRADAAWRGAGLERITPHECRHTCATWLDAAGARPRVVSEWLGHSVPQARGGAAVTQRYTHVLPDDLAHAAEQLEQFLVRERRVVAGG